MKKIFGRAAVLLLTFMVLTLFSGCNTGGDAKTIEEITGIYGLCVYDKAEAGETLSMLGEFEYFYLAVGEGTFAKIAFKRTGEEPYEEEYSYICKYASGSDELVEEIKFRFIMPCPVVEEGLAVNYLSVRRGEELACRKVMYVSIESGEPAIIRLINISMRKLQGEDLFAAETVLAIDGAGALRKRTAG